MRARVRVLLPRLSGIPRAPRFILPRQASASLGYRYLPAQRGHSAALSLQPASQLLSY
jgi:hypothetical protein